MFDQQFQNPSRVVVTVNFYKRDMDGNPTFNDETGARFWTAPTSDGAIRMVAKVDKAQGVTKKGMDISDAINGVTADLRLSREDFKLLKSECKTMDEGVGAQFIVELSKEPVFGQLNITKSRRGRNGVKKSMVITGVIAGDEIRPATATLTDTVQLDSKEDILAHINEMKSEDVAQAEQARSNRQTEAAKAGMAEAATGAAV